MDNLSEFSHQLNTTKQNKSTDIKLNLKENNIQVDYFKKAEDSKPIKIELNFIKEGTVDLLDVVKIRSKQLK